MPIPQHVVREITDQDTANQKFNIQKTNIMASSPITAWQIDGETVETVADYFFWAPKSLQSVIAAMKLKDIYSLEESYDKLLLLLLSRFSRV